MKNISVISTDYTHFKNALNKEAALNEIIEQRCQDAINSAAMAKPVNYKILEKLRDDSTVSEKIKQSADSWIKTLNKLFGEEIVNGLSGLSEEYLQKQLLEKQFFTSKKSTEEHSDKSTEGHSFEHDQDLTVKKYISSMLLQFAVLDKNIGTVKALLDFDADPRVEDDMHCTAISFAIGDNNKEVLKAFVDWNSNEEITKISMTPFSCNSLEHALSTTEIDIVKIDQYLSRFYDNTEILGHNSIEDTFEL